jgi:hypothetical protein
MPDMSWTMRPLDVIAAAKEAAQRSVDGHGLTKLERAFWERKHLTQNATTCYNKEVKGNEPTPRSDK